METVEDSPRLGFTFRLAGGSGLLTLGRRTFFGWLHLDRLELDVPNLRLPVDLATGAEAFQRHRTRARAAALRMEQQDLDRFVAGRSRALEELGVEELRLACSDGSLGLSGRVREAGQAADFTARLFADADGERLRIACARAVVYGHLPTPAPLVAHRILTALVDTTPEARAEPGQTQPPPFAFAFSATTTASGTHPGFASASPPGTGRHELERESTGGPWSSAVRGLGQVDLDPLALTLWHVLPTAGWRLPDTRGLSIADVRLGPDALVVGYRPGPTAGEDEDGATSMSARMPESAILFDSLDRLREADDRLVAGDAMAAMRLYRTRLASHTDDEPLLLERMLAVGASRRELFDDTAELASHALARWPDFAPAQAALASIAVARGDAQGAGTRYRTLSQIAVAAGDRDAAALAALAGARLLRRTSPAEATPLSERALELAPGHGEASEALADRYAEERRFADLVGLLRARASAATDVVRRARDHVRAAHILVSDMADPTAARRELDAATHIDPHNPAAHEVIAEIEAVEGRPAAGAEALQRAARIYQDRRDRRGRTRALLRAAAMLEQAGDAERAESGYRAVLELAPGEPAALRGAALAASRRGEHSAAARMWRQLVSLSAGSSAAAARDSLELARCLLASGDAGEREAAESALRRAA
ncbi:MAG TPA: hypothetical protein VMZ28_16240, partial [Kofleriaceae bacterium]|nr:hypothetical protein [Kofleriaceae bacterium]